MITIRIKCLALLFFRLSLMHQSKNQKSSRKNNEIFSSFRKGLLTKWNFNHCWNACALSSLQTELSENLMISTNNLESSQTASSITSLGCEWFYVTSNVVWINLICVDGNLRTGENFTIALKHRNLLFTAFINPKASLSHTFVLWCVWSENLALFVPFAVCSYFV